ncbi:hypothetical protein GPECTOR_6g892 [Gonium pectorale]|uniref:G-patch domain-containing protein n=1 Tax=Gonium pectorale TaxID=33097 RepID=A0A150GW31_GONPE|nr:hypothetical protein GPECTOR_6g892 [Gonium pectorale]|eukprot:KXZ53973.1 hypothetical protein GPECTOR_6g892 [Gonium pectorale]
MGTYQVSRSGWREGRGLGVGLWRRADHTDDLGALARGDAPSAPQLPPGASGPWYRDGDSASSGDMGGGYGLTHLAAAGGGGSGAAAAATDPWVGQSAGAAAAAGGSSLLTAAAGEPPAGVSGLLGRIGGLLGRRGGGGGGGGRDAGTGGDDGGGGVGWGGASAQDRMRGGGGGYAGGGARRDNGERIMQRMRDLLFADASLFKVEGGAVTALVEGDALRLRLKQRSRPPSPQQQQLDVGDRACLDLNPPHDPEPLPFLRAAPGVFTFRCPRHRLLLKPGGAASDAGGGGPAWPGAGERRGHGRRGGGGAGISDESSDGDGGGAAAANDMYYCLTVSPTVCDSCGLDELDAVLAAYTRFSEHHAVPYTTAANSQRHGAGAAAATVVPGIPVVAATAAAAAGGAAGKPYDDHRAAPAGEAAYPPVTPSAPPYGPYPAVPPMYGGAQYGQSVSTTRGTQVVAVAPPPSWGPYTAAAAAAAVGLWPSVAAAVSSPEGAAQLAGRAVATARAVGAALVETSHSLAYGIRRRADDVVRSLPPPATEPDRTASGRPVRAAAGAAAAATLLPLRAVVLALWLVARAAALVVGVLTEALAGAGAWGAEVVLFAGALAARWLPMFGAWHRARHARRRLRHHGAGGGGQQAPPPPSVFELLAAALAALAVPGHLARTAAGAALLIYGELHGSLEESFRVLLRAVSDAAAQLAARAGGPSAGGLARRSLEAAGYTLDALTGLRKVGLRAVAREYQRRHATALLEPPPPPALRGRRRR